MKLFPPIFTMGLRIATTLIAKGLQIGGKKLKRVTAYSQPRCASGEFGAIKTSNGMYKNEELAEKCEYIDERCENCPIAAYGCTACRDLF